MPGVLRELAEYIIDINEGSKLVKQLLRHFSLDKKVAIKKEITKLMAVGFIREILHPNSLANPILVQKKNMAEWSMCVDYMDLNRHCPKDPFGLPHIDQIVDSTVGSALLSFLDCYSGYLQVALREEDQSKTSFITLFGAYSYKTMSFGLKNAGATYQRAIQTCLGEHIGENTKAYVDDVVVKTKDLTILIQDLKQTFDNLKSGSGNSIQTSVFSVYLLDNYSVS
jgi:hypothetical protein